MFLFGAPKFVTVHLMFTWELHSTHPKKEKDEIR